jgi:hypothetical protein
MRKTDELLARYQDQIGADRDRAYQTSGTYRWQHDTLTQMLRHIEAVLTDEGLPAETIERVLRCVIYGGPSAVDAEYLEARMAEVADMLGGPPQFVMDMETGKRLGWRPPR